MIVDLAQPGPERVEQFASQAVAVVRIELNQPAQGRARDNSQVASESALYSWLVTSE